MAQKHDIVCLSHREDPDGIVSAVLIKNLFQAQIHLVDYDDFLIELEKIIQNNELKKLIISDLSINSNIQSKFLSLIENLSQQNISILHIDHHKINDDFKQKLNKLNVELINIETDCSSALIFNHFRNKFQPFFSFLTACASITDNLENGPIAKNITCKHEKMYLYLNSSLLWFHVRKNLLNHSELYKIVNELSSKNLPHQILDNFSSLSSYLNDLENSYSNIEKNVIEYKNFNCFEIFDGKFSDTAEKTLRTSGKNFSLVFKKIKKDLSIELVILSNNNVQQDLGLITNSICSKFGGAGGGDKTKSAAIVSQKNFKSFLLELDLSL